METKASNALPRGPMISEIRLSRLTHPRASLLAIILLAAVFVLFGMFANALPTHPVAPPNTFDGAAFLISDWVLGR
ncbi:MAG: hypothetical protein R3E82_00780 [Pseudomonadales bacterium]|nr:hypothetical protein [Pseudomonadales bacterium]